MPPRLLPALVLYGALLAVPGCGGGDDDEGDAEQTVRDFVTATNERDSERFCGELVTQEFLEQSTGAKGDEAEDACRKQLDAITGLEVKLVRIQRTVIDGDRARVTAILKTQGATGPQLLRLKEEDGDWRLAGGTGR